MTLLDYFVELVRGIISNPSVLEQVSFHVLDSYISARRRRLLALPSCNLQLVRESPLVHSVTLLNGVLAGNPDLDLFHSTSAVYRRTAMDYLQHAYCAVWTADSVCTLLRLYESKLAMLKTPKKKTRIWIAISDNLKDYDIMMSPDQVRWKINALTKKYKECLDSGQHSRFKYFTELNNIYSLCNLTYYTSELIHKKYTLPDNIICHSVDHEIRPESKAIIELRKNRLNDKMESDRCQSKVRLEKQWLEYLKNQEDQRLLKDEINERKLQLREKKLELRKRELETRESTELRKLQLTEQEHNEVLKLEREKYEMLREMYS